MVRTHDCRNECGGQIYFDPEFKTESGKWIPMDAQTHEAHQCPNAPNRPQQSQQGRAQPTVVGGNTTKPYTEMKGDNWLIPKADWDMLQDYLRQISTNLERITENQTDMLDHMRVMATTTAAKKPSVEEREQELQRQEEEYDKAKEDGTVGSFPKED